VAGTPETVASLSKSSLVDFLKGNFTGSRMAVAGTGGVTAEGLAAGVGAWSVGSGATGALDAPAVPSVFTGSDVRARFDSYPVRKGEREGGRQVGVVWCSCDPIFVTHRFLFIHTHTTHIARARRPRFRDGRLDEQDSDALAVGADHHRELG